MAQARCTSVQAINVLLLTSLGVFISPFLSSFIFFLGPGMGMDAEGFLCFFMLPSASSFSSSPSVPLSRKATSPNSWQEKHSRRENLSPSTASRSTDGFQGHHGSGCRMTQKTICHVSASDGLQPLDFFWQPLPMFSSTCCDCSPGAHKLFYWAATKPSHLGNNLTCLLVPRGFPEIFANPSDRRAKPREEELGLGHLDVRLEI